MVDLSDIIARVEGAAGADREIDVQVFRAIGAPVPFQFATTMIALTYDEAERCYFAPVADMRVRYEPPQFTASIDAAMTLVPEGWHVSTIIHDRWKPELWFVALRNPGREPATSKTKGLANALTAAALRALSAGSGKGE